MSTETSDIKEAVKQKYGEAALRVKSGAAPAVVPRQRPVAVIPLPLTSTTLRRPDRYLKRRCWLRLAAAILRRSPN
jgi:hypothetical protein